MTGGLILIFGSLIGVCLFFGIMVARRRSPSRRAFAMLVLIVFAVTYIWSALFEIWINGASVLRPASLIHAFGPGQAPSQFLVQSLFWLVPAMILAGGAYAVTHRRKKDVMT
ncbi:MULTISPECIES: hypothetical protein [unclassified Ruegeria]|uniref:hypothetical protein n=1 Tax=unclassified Ruegeria TaxID=2625375 RepID=UPI001AD9ACAB|nr:MULTISPECIES: hypothetical protein [unclassified Ruegeria]MBO9411838.1 hypothetical protein [Ruegeria sp. R8_1]MBO9415601.1 hypothetical protein [Ruegeria sp. R8_2]